MFNIFELKNIKDLDYKEIFKTCLPKGNKSLIEKQDKYNIISGALLIIIGIIISFITLILLNNLLESNTASFIEKVTIFGIHYSLLGSLILPLIIPITIPIYFNLNKDKNIKSFYTYILMIYSIIYSVYLILTLFTWIISTFLSISLALIGILSLIIKLIGNIFIIIGSFNFTEKCGREYNPKEVSKIEINIEFKNNKKEEIKNDKTYLEETSEEDKINYKTVDKSNWTYKYCPRCALKVPIDKEICDHCGCDLRNV